MLTVQERDQRLAELNDEQRRFLVEKMNRSRRTAFANAMARDKGYHIPADAEFEDIEQLLEDWIYVGYIDAGKVTSDLKCECGRSLRYQHHVEHKKTGESRKFGIEHLKDHLQIDASLVSTIMKGLDAVDYELDEVLTKIQNNWQPEPDIKNHPELTNEMLEMLELQLPLLDRHIRRLRQTKTYRSALTPEKSMSSSFSLPTSKDMSSLGNQAEFDFGEKVDVIVNEETFNPFAELPLHYVDIVRNYIEEGIRSARTICELLIREHGAPKARYITGKPKIYIALCLLIEQHIPVVMTKDLGRTDRQYFV